MADAQTPVLTDPRIAYIARWGGNCRDCADENGVCPRSGLPCADSERAIKHVLSALDYGAKHGYLLAAQAPAQRAVMQQALDALEVCRDAFQRIREAGGRRTSAEIVAETAIAALSATMEKQ